MPDRDFLKYHVAVHWYQANGNIHSPIGSFASQKEGCSRLNHFLMHRNNKHIISFILRKVNGGLTYQL